MARAFLLVLVGGSLHHLDQFIEQIPRQVLPCSSSRHTASKRLVPPIE
jgi:hypothetical protein